MSGVAPAPASDRRVWVIAAVALTLLPLVAVSPLRDAMVELLAWLRTAGLSGVLVFSAAYVIATLLALPAALPTAAAGFVYGPWLGLLLVSPVSVLAATLAFGASRWLVRDRVAALVARDVRWSAIERAVAQRAWLLVFLLRLSPVVPFNLLNYALGVAPVRLRDYVVASWLGMLPGTWLYVYVGSLADDATQLARGQLDMPATASWLYWSGLAATVLATLWIGRWARRAMAQALEVTNATQRPPTAGPWAAVMADKDALRAPRLCIFVKEPRPGRVKTRLAAGVGDARAVELARAFFIDTLAMATAQSTARVVVVLDGDASGLPRLPEGVALWPQGDGDLGSRLERCLKRALLDAPSAVVIGADSPGLPNTRVEAALGLLRSADAVIGPAEDGGFYLLGVTRCPDGALAELPWSAPDTCARTLSRLARLHLSVACLPTWFDVDEPPDLQRLKALLATGAVAAPATARLLGVTPPRAGS